MPTNTPGVATAWVLNVRVPADGEDVSEANDGPGWVDLCNRTQWLRQTHIQMYSFGYNSDIADDSVDDLPTAHASSSYTYGSQDIADEDLFVDILDCVIGDIIQVHFWGHLIEIATAPSDATYVKLFAVEDLGGADTYHPIPGTLRTIDSAEFAAHLGVQINLVGSWTVTVAGDVRIEYGVRRATSSNGVGFHKAFGMTAMVKRVG